MVCWGRWRTINGKPVCIKDKMSKPVVITALVLVTSAVGGGAVGGVGGTARAGSAAESVVGQSIQTRVTSSRNAARRGQYSQAWQRMGLRVVTRDNQQELECAAHSYGQVREFFRRTPCRSLQRTLLVVGDGQGNTTVVSIAWVRMRNAVTAQRLKRLVDTDGSGNIVGAALEHHATRFTGKHYASRRAGSLVVIAEAAPGTGRPDPGVLDGAAKVAVMFPPP